MRKRIGVSSPKKPTRFTKIDVIKRYVFISSYDELFDLGEDGMRQVDFIDYGLEWEKLPRGATGNTACFEIVDFTAMCPEEQAEFNKKWEAEERMEQQKIDYRRAQRKLHRRIRNILLGCYLKKYRFLPSLVHGRTVLTLMTQHGPRSMETLPVRMGAFLVSLALSYCFLRRFSN